MNKNEILEKLKLLVKPYVKNQEAFESLNEKTDLLADLKINSANLVDIILDIEETFDIVIDNDSMQRMLNVKSVMDIVTTKLSEK
ncbi:MAG TPA: hypothetical protein VK623_04395 [Flavobacterium sp.]|nr:hypothetical protein [Flavobacterium sp.]